MLSNWVRVTVAVRVGVRVKNFQQTYLQAKATHLPQYEISTKMLRGLLGPGAIKKGSICQPF